MYIGNDDVDGLGRFRLFGKRKKKRVRKPPVSVATGVVPYRPPSPETVRPAVYTYAPLAPELQPVSPEMPMAPAPYEMPQAPELPPVSPEMPMAPAPEPMEVTEETENRARYAEAEIQEREAEAKDEGLSGTTHISGISDSISEAVDYIKSKVADLFKQAYVLDTQKRKVQELMGIAIRKGDMKSFNDLSTLSKSIDESKDRQVDLESKISTIQKYTGLSLIPLIIVAVAIPTAVLLALHYKKISAQQKSLEMIEKGLITPGEAQALMPSGILPSFGEIGSTVKWIAILGVVGLGGYFILTRKR